MSEVPLTADDLRLIEESFMDDLELEANNLNSEIHTSRSSVQSETSSLNRNAGMSSLFGKFLYSFKFSQNFIKVEKTDKGNLGTIQFYQTEGSGSC